MAHHISLTLDSPSESGAAAVVSVSASAAPTEVSDYDFSDFSFAAEASPRPVTPGSTMSVQRSPWPSPHRSRVFFPADFDVTAAAAASAATSRHLTPSATIRPVTGHVSPRHGTRAHHGSHHHRANSFSVEQGAMAHNFDHQISRSEIRRSSAPSELAIAGFMVTYAGVSENGQPNSAAISTPSTVSTRRSSIANEIKVSISAASSRRSSRFRNLSVATDSRPNSPIYDTRYSISRNATVTNSNMTNTANDNVFTFDVVASPTTTLQRSELVAPSASLSPTPLTPRSRARRNAICMVRRTLSAQHTIKDENKTTRAA
jgi:hypothetical protein